MNLKNLYKKYQLTKHLSYKLSIRPKKNNKPIEDSIINLVVIVMVTPLSHTNRLNCKKIIQK